MWLRDYSPVGGEDHSTLSPLRDDPHDDVPHESPRHRVHPGRGLLYIVGMRVGGNYKSQARVFDAADMLKNFTAHKWQAALLRRTATSY